MDKYKTPSKRSSIESSTPISKTSTSSRMLLGTSTDRLSELQALTNKMNEAQSIKRSTAPPPVTKPSITANNPILMSPFLKKNDITIESKKEIKSTPNITKLDIQTLPKPPTKEIEKLSRNYDEEIKILHDENETLKIQLQKLTSNDDVEHLTSDIAEILHSNELLSKELEEAKEKIQIITSKLKTAEVEISETMIGVEALHEENSLLEKKIKQSNKEDNLLKLKLQELNDKIKLLTLSDEENKSIISKSILDKQEQDLVNKNFIIQQEKNQSLLIELETIKSKLQVSEDFSKTNINQINNYIKDIQILKDENKSINLKINEVNQQLEAANLKISIKNEELSLNNEKNITSNLDNDKIISDNKNLKEKNLLLMKQLELKTEELLVSQFSSEEIMSEPTSKDNELIKQNEDLIIQLEKLKEELENKISKLNSSEEENKSIISKSILDKEEQDLVNKNFIIQQENNQSLLIELETIKSKLQVSEDFSKSNINQINNYIKDIKILKDENNVLSKLSEEENISKTVISKEAEKNLKIQVDKNHSLLTELALTSKDLIETKSKLEAKEKENFELSSQLNNKINNSANDDPIKIEINNPSKSSSIGIKEDTSCNSIALGEVISSSDEFSTVANESDINNDIKNIGLIKDSIDITSSIPTSTNKVLVHKFASWLQRAGFAEKRQQVVILSSQHRPQKEDEIYTKSRTKFKKPSKEKIIIDSENVDIDKYKEEISINNDEIYENSYSFHQKQFDDFLNFSSQESQEIFDVGDEKELIDKNSIIIGDNEKEEKIVGISVDNIEIKKENISVVNRINENKLEEIENVIEKVNDEIDINIVENDVKNNKNSEKIIDPSVFEEIVEIITTTSEIKFDEEDNDDNKTGSTTYKPPIAHQQIILPNSKNSDTPSKRTPNKLQSMMSKFKNVIKLDHSNTTLTDQIKEKKDLFGRNKAIESSEIDESLIVNIKNTKKSEKNANDAEDDGYAWVDPVDEDDGLTELTINGEVKLYTAQELYFLVLEELLLLRIELEGKNKKSIFGNHKMWF